MHEAYEVTSLLKLTEQIESIAAYDDNLLVGTRQGHLMMYLVSQSNDTNKYKIQVLRYHKTFSKKPIQQIDVIPEFHLLLCLSDNLLVLHDINIIHFPIIQTIQDTKGATLFALSNETALNIDGDKNPVIKLAVAVKRKIQLYYLKKGEFKSLTQSIVVADIPKVMAWGQSVICVGFKDEYTFYNFDGNTKAQFLTSSSRSMDPCITKISKTSFMLSRDQASVVVDEAQPSTPSDTVMKVNEPLIGGAADDPYILGLISDQISVFTLGNFKFIQTLSDLNRARILYRCRSGLLYVASMSQIWRVGLVDIIKQRQVLLKDKQFELALKLTEISDESTEEKNQKRDYIRMLYALDLFDSKKFSESMEIFLELNMNPVEVIKLFPSLAPGEGSEQEIEDDFATPRPPDPEMENGIQALIRYLRVVRLKVQDKGKEGKEKQNQTDVKQHNPILEDIDTTLLKCYLQTNDAFIGPLLRLNNCKFEEAEKVLVQHNKHSELIILYQTNGQHTKALQFMKQQAKEPDSSLKGYKRTKTYLQQLGSEHLNLIFEFSSWILNEHPEEGLKIFTDDVLEVENFPRAKVLDFLLRDHESLVIPYLEHIIHVWNDNNAIFHNALVSKLREKLMDKKNVITDVQYQHTKLKLLNFLEKSNYYSPEMVLVHFPTDSLFEERAVVLGKLDAHEQALSIYIYILGNVELAIRYCDNVSARVPENKKNKDIYVLLIRLLVNPSQELLLKGPLWNVPRSPVGNEPDLPTAIRILEKNADKIDPIKALSILPDSIPIEKIKSFLETAIHNQLRKRRSAQVMKGLLYAENLKMQEQKMVHESQSVMLADFNVCTVCKKRFGNQSAFVRYPNGEIVHYSCQEKK